jgi:hypothetical protein
MADAEQIGAMTERLGDIAQHIQAVDADADKDCPLYEARSSPSATKTQRGPRP